MRRGNHLHNLIVTVLFVMFCLSCSSSGSPVTPDTQTAISTQRQYLTHPNEVMWGMWDVIISPDTGTAEIVPQRSMTFEANVTRFLHPPAVPINMMSVDVLPGTDFPTGYVKVDVTIRHPFPGTNLRGFDVLGIFMPEGGEMTSEWDPDIIWTAPDSDEHARLLNADGYTRWWNMTEFTSYDTIFGYTEGRLAVPGFTSGTILNPYKYFADNIEPGETLESTDFDVLTRGSFDTVTPGVNSRVYEIQFPVSTTGPNFRFKYAITSSYWGPEEGTEPPAEIDDFPLTANRPEAVHIEVNDNGSWAFYENATTYGGDLKFDISITDWQGMSHMSGAVPEIGGIYAESPTLFDGVIDLSNEGMLAWEPFNPTITHGQVTIPDVTPTGVLNQYILFIVTSADPTDYSVQLDDISGFAYPEDAVLATFTVWRAPIANIGPQQNLPPVADASNSDWNDGGAPPLDVALDPSASYDTDGEIVLYEWDIENDGSYEYSCVDPEVFAWQFSTPGAHEIQLRVTDDDDAVDLLDEPLVVNVSDEDPCTNGPNFIVSGDGNIFVDSYVEDADNAQFFTNIINFDLGGPNSQNTIVKYYTGHGGTHNNSPITGAITDLVEGSGFTLIDTSEEPIDLTGCRIVFICLPDIEFSQDEYDTLVQFMADGGRIVLTQEYSDGSMEQATGNALLDGIGSTIERLNTSTTYQLTEVPNECYAITNGVNHTFNPAYTSFEPGDGDMTFVYDTAHDYHVIVGDWID